MNLGNDDNALDVKIQPEIYQRTDSIQEYNNNYSLKNNFVFNLEADAVSTMSILTTPYSIRFSSELNNLLRFNETHYTNRTQKSEKPVLIITTDNFPFKCDCFYGSIVNRIREQTLFYFNSSSYLEYSSIQ